MTECMAAAATLVWINTHTQGDRRASVRVCSEDCVEGRRRGQEGRRRETRTHAHGHHDESSGAGVERERQGNQEECVGEDGEEREGKEERERDEHHHDQSVIKR